MTSVKTKVLKPVYLIYSEQKFLLEEAIKRLKKQVTSQSLGELNVTEIASPQEFEQLEIALSTMGFFDQQKIIILHQADKLSKPQAPKMIDYSKSPNKGVTLILVALKKNETLFKQAKEGHFFFEYKSPKKGQLSQWVIDYFKKEGKKVDFEVATYLVSMLGDDLSLLANEIQKIALYAGERHNLVIGDVKAVCCRQAHETIFDLVDALGQTDLPLALWHLNNLFHTEKEGRIFHMIVRQFRLLLKTKGLVSKESGLAQMSRTLGLPSFIVTKYMQQARHFSVSKLTNALSILLDTEVAYKTTATPVNSALELALVKILAA